MGRAWPNHSFQVFKTLIQSHFHNSGTFHINVTVCSKCHVCHIIGSIYIYMKSLINEMLHIAMKKMGLLLECTCISIAFFSSKCK